MNFELSREQKMIVDSVSTFIKERGVERFRELRITQRGWDPETWRAMGDYGWLGIAAAEELGGIGGSFVDLALVLDQLGRGLAPEPVIPSVVLAGGILERLGSAEQKSELLEPMLRGETSLALAYGERQSRYDLADCLARAERTSSGYRLTGEKIWVLNGHAADSLLLVARTSGEQLDSDGLSFFVVRADAEGLQRTAVPGMDGQRTAHLRFDTEVPAEALVGDEGAAFATLDWAVDRAAAAACAEGQGLIEELFARTVEYLEQREQFGRKIGSFQALQHRAAEMFAERELCRGTMILAAIRADSDDVQQRRADISAAKLQLQQGGWFIQKHAIQLHGGIGMTDENDLGLYFKRLRVLNALFGDADHHVARYQSLDRFEGVA